MTPRRRTPRRRRRPRRDAGLLPRLESALRAIARRLRPLRRRLRPHRRRIAVVALLVVAGLFLWWRSPPPPGDLGDLCSIYRERLGWYRDSRAAARRWEVREEVVVAILVQESSLRARARPPRRKLFGFVPWRRPSTAYGYAQVVDATWRQYQSEIGRAASRRRFADAADFVAWYARELRAILGLDRDQIEELYLAYHQGPGGFTRGSYRAMPTLRASARRVAARASRYRVQLDGCRQDLERALWWRDLRRAGLLLLAALAAGWLLRARMLRRAPARRRRRR